MTRPTAVLALLAMCLITGCGTAPTPSGPSASAPTNESTEGTKPGPVVLDVTILDGQVTPRGARIELKVGQPLTLSVASDTNDEIHVHTDPEREFRVEAGEHHRFTFRVDEPAKVAVEVHDLDAVIAEVLVRK